MIAAHMKRVPKRRPMFFCFVDGLPEGFVFAISDGDPPGAPDAPEKAAYATGARGKSRETANDDDENRPRSHPT